MVSDATNFEGEVAAMIRLKQEVLSDNIAK